MNYVTDIKVGNNNIETPDLRIVKCNSKVNFM